MQLPRHPTTANLLGFNDVLCHSLNVLISGGAHIVAVRNGLQVCRKLDADLPRLVFEFDDHRFDVRAAGRRLIFTLRLDWYITEDVSFHWHSRRQRRTTVKIVHTPHAIRRQIERHSSRGHGKVVRRATLLRRRSVDVIRDAILHQNAAR